MLPFTFYFTIVNQSLRLMVEAAGVQLDQDDIGTKGVDIDKK